METFWTAGLNPSSPVLGCVARFQGATTGNRSPNLGLGRAWFFPSACAASEASWERLLLRFKGAPLGRSTSRPEPRKGSSTSRQIEGVWVAVRGGGRCVCGSCCSFLFAFSGGGGQVTPSWFGFGFEFLDLVPQWHLQTRLQNSNWRGADPVLPASHFWEPGGSPVVA